MAEKILILDDDKDIADILEIYLSNENFEIYKYNYAKEALVAINNIKFDLAMLDIMLPEVNGFDICREIRTKYNYPILMISAKDASVDKIKGFTLGADDYITKPFDPLEVVVRVKAQIRRYKKYNTNYSENNADTIEYLGLMLDLKRYACFLNGKMLNLTPTEFKILLLLIKSPGRVYSAEEIYERVWNEQAINTDTIMVHVRKIREKIEMNPREPKYLKVVWGVGYKIEKQ